PGRPGEDGPRPGEAHLVGGARLRGGCRCRLRQSTVAQGDPRPEHDSWWTGRRPGAAERRGTSRGGGRSAGPEREAWGWRRSRGARWCRWWGWRRSRKARWRRWAEGRPRWAEGRPWW